MMHELRYALRSLSRARGFAFTVILTLGLGIGANTAIFSAVRGVLLKPLPNRDGDRLMYLRQSAELKGSDNIAFSVPEINDFRSSSKTLGQIAEYSPLTLNLIEDEGASQVQVGLVTGNYFDVMGLAPILGHGFTASDDGGGAAPVMMLTYEYWREHFGADPTIVGKSLRIGGRTAEVVGVLQQAPFFPQKIDALMNMSISQHHVSATMVQGRTHRMTEMIARLAPGATRRAGARRSRDDHRAGARRVSRDLRRGLGLHGDGHSLQGSARQGRAAHPLAAHGRGGVRAGHRLRQRGEPHPDARRAPRARDAGAGRAGGRHGTAPPAAPRGAPGPRAGGRGRSVSRSPTPGSACWRGSRRT